MAVLTEAGKRAKVRRAARFMAISSARSAACEPSSGMSIVENSEGADLTGIVHQEIPARLPSPPARPGPLPCRGGGRRSATVHPDGRAGSGSCLSPHVSAVPVQELLLCSDTDIARATVDGNVELVGSILVVSRLVEVCADLREARLHQYFAQTRTGVNARGYAARDLNHHVASAAVCFDRVAAGNRIADFYADVSSTRPCPHTQVCRVLGQNHSHIATTGIR